MQQQYAGSGQGQQQSFKLHSNCSTQGIRAQNQPPLRQSFQTGQPPSAASCSRKEDGVDLISNSPVVRVNPCASIPAAEKTITSNKILDTSIVLDCYTDQAKFEQLIQINPVGDGQALDGPGWDMQD